VGNLHLNNQKEEGKTMNKRIMVLILALGLVPGIVHATVLVSGSFEDGTNSPFGRPYGGSSAVKDSTAPDGSYSLKFTYPGGLYGGVAPDIAGKSFAQTNEVWIQYWFKYSSNWRWNTNMNKQIYVLTGAQGSTDVNFFIGAKTQYGDTMNFSTQHQSGGNQTFRSSGWDLTKDVWHKVVLHVSMNTAGVQDGIAQMWVDGVLRINQSDVLYRKAGQSTGFSQFQMTPVYGGGQETIPTEQYMWFDHVIVQTTPISEYFSPLPVPSTGALKEPAPPSSLMIIN
jgi:hypothetical protein